MSKIKVGDKVMLRRVKDLWCQYHTTYNGGVDGHGLIPGRFVGIYCGKIGKVVDVDATFGLMDYKIIFDLGDGYRWTPEWWFRDVFLELIERGGDK